jgi:hypothetical protein
VPIVGALVPVGGPRSKSGVAASDAVSPKIRKRDASPSYS